jgi:hypothetical protein
MTTDQAEASGMDVVLGEELHSLQYVGVDTDSSRTASTIKSDFLWLNTSKLATQGKALHGVGGGVAECGGVGPMVVAVTIDQQTGEEAVIVDPEGQFIKKSSPIDPDFRLFGQNRLKVMGLPLKQDYNDTGLDVLRCKRTGQLVELVTSSGILVLKTSRRDAKDLVRFLDMKTILGGIAKGERSPLVMVSPAQQRNRVKGAKRKADAAVGGAAKAANFSCAVGGAGNSAAGRCTDGEGGSESLPSSGGGACEHHDLNARAVNASDHEWDYRPRGFHKCFEDGYKSGAELLTSAIAVMLTEPRERALFLHSSEEEYTVMVLNESKLSQEQRARLWHWRLGHCNPQLTVDMSKQGLVSGLDVRHVLNEDCTECDKAKFRKGTFRRNTLETRRFYPPFYKVYADGFGGQKSFGKASLDGGKGSFIFVDLGTGAIVCKLYAQKSQFCILVKRFFIEVEAQDYFVRILVLDGTGENIDSELQTVCDMFKVVIEFTSAASPQELATAEKGVQDIGRIVRALFVSAPHAPQSFWGLALLYACIIHFVLPHSANNGRSPYLMVNRRAPQINRMFFRVWMAPAEFVPKESSNVRTDELTVDGYFAGVEGGSVLVARKRDWKVFRVSRRHVRVHEGSYIEHPSVREQRKLLAIEEEGEQEVPVSAVPSIRSLRLPTKQQEAGAAKDMGHGVEDDDAPVQPYVEEHLEIETQDAISKVDALESAVQSWREKDMSGGGAAHDALVQKLKALKNDLASEAAGEYAKGIKRKSTGAAAESIPSKRKYKSKNAEVDDANIIDSNTKRGFKPSRPDPKADHFGVDDSDSDDEDGESESIESEDPEPKKLMKVYQLPRGARVEIDTTRFDGDKPGSYSSGKPATIQGSITGKKSGGVITVRWDDGDVTDSHWSHLRSLGLKQTVESMLMAAECMGVYAALAAQQDGVLTEEAEKVAMKVAPPRNFFECLLRDDWKQWIESIRREMKGWDENDAWEEIEFDESSPEHPIVELAELFSIKRDGRYKLRLIALGNILRKSLDYKETFAATVTADGLRWFLSMACACNKQIYGGDVATAYLTGEQRTDLSSYIPSFGELYKLPIDALRKMRGELQTMEKKEGIRAIRRLSKRKGRPKKLWRLKSPIYGIPDAGNAFALKFQNDHTQKLKMSQSVVDPCIYWKFKYAEAHGPATEGQTSDDMELRREAERVGIKIANDGRIVVGYIFLISWVDDVRYFGTGDMVAWYRKTAPGYMPITDEGESNEFVSLEIKQDLVNGTLEVTQSKYFLAAAKRFAQHLEGLRIPDTPLPEGWKPTEGADEDRAAAKGKPMRELIGVLAYPSTYVKLEIRLAISFLFRYLHAPTIEHWNMALRVLMYCVGTHDIGLMYSRGLDEHGVNVLYAYADSNFEAPKSTGGRMVFMNGAVISASSQRHSTVDTSTTEAELTECFRCGCDVMGFRNLMDEIGLINDEPTLLYQDNTPAIQIMNNKGSLASRTKFMDIRVFKVREWISEGSIMTRYCRTLEMAADIGTKALGTKQFRFCRDLMNGYALAQLGGRNKPTEVSAMVISREELLGT